MNTINKRKINLLPVDVKSGKYPRIYRRRWLYTIPVLVVLIFLGITLGLSLEVTSKISEINLLRGMVNSANASLNDYSNLEQCQKNLKNRVNSLKKNGPNFNWISFFTELPNLVPEGICITEFVGDPSGIIAINGETVNYGDIDNFAKALLHSGEITEIELQKAEFNVDTLLINFTIKGWSEPRAN